MLLLKIILYLQDWIVDPNFPLVWRLDKNICGSGANGDINAHIIDLARYLVEEFHDVMDMTKTFINERPLVEEMTGLTATSNNSGKKGKVTVDDASIFMTHFKNGALGTFEATRFATGNKNNMSFEINGSKGSIKFAFERMNELQYYNQEDDNQLQGFRTISVTEGSHDFLHAWWPPGHIIGYEHTFIHKFSEFAQSIINKKSAIPDFYDGYMCNVILDCVEQSTIERT